MLGNRDRELDKRAGTRLAASFVVSESSFGPTPPRTGLADSGGSDDCDRTAAYLPAYADNELDADHRLSVENHLNKCVLCAASLDRLQQIDRYIQREWRESAPLPSSSDHTSAVASIMAALPPAAELPVSYAPRRVHVRIRWSRIATAAAGLAGLVSLMWSSHSLGRTRNPQKAQSPVGPNYAPVTSKSQPLPPLSTIADSTSVHPPPRQR